MPRSVCLNPAYRETAYTALQRNGFLTQGEFAIHLDLAASTVSKFFTGKAIYVSKFEQICETLGLDTREMARSSDVLTAESLQPERVNERYTNYPDFLSYDRSWVGRELLIAELQTALQSRRLLMILGLTGIGKTALAECLIVKSNFALDSNRFQRVNCENIEKAGSFSSIAIEWLKAWNVTLSPEERQPERLCDRLLDYLSNHAVVLLFDSLETLLAQSDDGYGGVFQDALWARFFCGFLSAQTMLSRIVVTSQELPLDMAKERYHRLWYRCVLTGLTEAEQVALFEVTGLDVSEESEERAILLRLGEAYRGHPLVLRAIIGEIWESFQGNVAAYWYEVQDNIVEVERAIAEAETDATKIQAADDEWKLHVLTRKIRLEVNKQRLQLVFERLKSQFPDAYLLLCVASVYRIPVEVKGWTMQLANFVQRLEGQLCSEERQFLALEELHHRFLLEEGINENNRRTLGQHPLVRSASLEHYRQLIERWKQSMADGKR